MNDRADVDFAPDRGQKRGFCTVLDHLGVDHAVPLADAEHNGLLAGTAPGLALDAARAEVALVDLDMPAKGALELARLGHALAQTTEKSIDGVAVEAGELGDLDGREIRGHVPQKSAENMLRNS